MKRKITSILLIVSMLAGLIAALPVTTSAYEMGDVNGDGSFNALDAALLSQVVLGQYASPSASNMGDMNGDGRLNAQDVGLLALCFVGRYEPSSVSYDVKDVVLGGADLCRYSIVLPEEIPNGAHIENAEYAAELLTTYIKGACGLTLSVAKSAGDHNIFFTYDETLGDEAFHITVRDGNVYLRCGLVRGPMYAAFGFLEEIMGVKFYPRDVIKYTPAEKIEIESGYEHEEGTNTAFRFRWSYNNCHIAAYYPTSNSSVFKTTFLSSHNTGSWDGNDWIMQARYGYSDCSDRNHSMYALVPTGGTLDVICFTDPGNRKTCSENLRLVIDGFLAKGYKLGYTMPYISISENDTSEWCACRSCKNLIAAHKGVQTATLVDFLNDMSDRLTPDYPGIKFWTLAYAGSVKAPEDMELRDNIYICFAPVCHCMIHTLEDNCFPGSISDFTYLEGWKKLTDNIHVWWYGCNYYMTLFYEPQVSWIFENVKTLAAYGVKGSFFENEEHTFGFTDFTSYMHSELVWNPDLTYEEYLEIAKRFCIDYYGSEAVYDILMLCEEMKSETNHIRAVNYSREGIPEYDADKVLANYDRFYELYDRAHEEAKGDDYARMNRALLGVESVVITDCHEALYVNGEGEEKELFTARYENFYNQIKGLGNTCYFSYFQSGLDATVPRVFTPYKTPYEWYIPKVIAE